MRPTEQPVGARTRDRRVLAGCTLGQLTRTRHHVSRRLEEIGEPAATNAH